MAEVARVRPNGFRAISLFSGCGGSSLGYRMAGFKVLWASEFVEAARDSYAANMGKGTILDGRDIRTVDPLEVLKTLGLEVGELDLLDGSPPCASFSTAGRREKTWGKVKKYSDKAQRTDDLFDEFTRFVRVMQPKTFVAENVSGLVKGVAKGYFIRILGALKACGYRVEAKLLDAQWLGVPQQRQRIIFVGVRNDLKPAPAFPTPLPYRYSIREALPWLDSVKWDSGGQHGSREFDTEREPIQTIQAGGGGSQLGYGVKSRIAQGEEVDFRNKGKSLDSAAIAGIGAFEIVPGKRAGQRRRGNAKPYNADEPAPTILAGTKGSGPHEMLIHVEPESDISRYEIGKEWDKLKPGEQSERYFSLVRSDPEKPVGAVTTAPSFAPSAAGVTHPFERRRFSIAELIRLCGFPDDVILTGSYAQRWERLGRAVPPVMAYHVARVIRDEILNKCAKPQKNVSGKKSNARGRTIAGRGRRRSTQADTATST